MIAYEFTSRVQLNHRCAFRFQGLILVSFLVAASAPSPLYAIYRDALGFSALTLTVVFASYAVGMLAALLFFGRLSDHLGRRELILAALLMECVSLVLFSCANSAGRLVWARVLQGLATGIATSAVGAGLLDIDQERGPLVSSVAPILGLSAGALGTSALVQYVGAPLQLSFHSLLAVFAVLVLINFFLPDTIGRRPGAWASIKPEIAIPAGAWAKMRRVISINAALWALSGFYLSLGPTLARTISGADVPMVGGALIATYYLDSAASMTFWRRRTPQSSLAAGAAGLSIGIGGLLVGILVPSTPVLFAGTALAGAGSGAAFIGAMQSIVPLVRPHERAAVISRFYVMSYLAFSLPAITAGMCVGHFGLRSTAVGFSCVVLMLSVVACLRAFRQRVA